MKKKEIDYDEVGIVGRGKGIVNVNSEDFKALQNAILESAKNQTPEFRRKLHLKSLKLQMETYISDEASNEVRQIGFYLKEHIKVIGVKNKTFAKYINIEESNLSSILRGKRKINIDLAFKLGQLFEASPSLWLLVQNKNELLNLDKNKVLKYKKYNLDDLLKKAS